LFSIAVRLSILPCKMNMLVGTIKISCINRFISLGKIEKEYSEDNGISIVAFGIQARHCCDMIRIHRKMPQMNILSRSPKTEAIKTSFL